MPLTAELSPADWCLRPSASLHDLAAAAFSSPARIRVQQGAAAVRCPYCRHDETKVIDSRTSQDLSIRRRRECLSCERRFTTYERIEESPIRVIKKDGTRVPFDREKIRFGVEKACYKRPVSPEQIDALVGSVEAAIYEDGEREVSSRRIGELVFNALRDLDKVAFVRFASVYREFQDVNDFVEELQPILDGRRRESLH
jgi:transcriptional repressor NrdR